MITARTPLRAPFAGGLTDIAEYAGRFGGTTVSATIGLAALVTVTPSENERFEWRDADGVEGTARHLDEVDNHLLRESLRDVDPRHEPVRVEISLEETGRSGLGASGAITVALLHALSANRGRDVMATELAERAARIEVEVLAGNSGYHDPHVCARGGLLRLDYQGAKVTERTVATPDGFLERFEESLLMFATGHQASTKDSLDRLSDGLERALPVLHEMKELAAETEAALAAGDLAGTAACIGRQQQLKQRLPGSFTHEMIGEVTGRLERIGAAVQFPGGKVGGYLIVCCPDGQLEEARALLPEFREVPLQFDPLGSRLVERGE